MSFKPDPILEAELSGLENLKLGQLQMLWQQRFGLVPKHQSADLLRRRLAYELQVRAYGGLRLEIRRRLSRLHKAFAADRKHTPIAGRHLKPGTILTREWKGTAHQVVLLVEGYEYAGERYQSLSEIAEKITRTKWSGPAFFGLRRRH
ncbi:DUF2924 domain-containing protein [Reyranella sp.]|uniref:DUF2924 domain-containing protein n=1 Tax=Reyranella sp. TaxID=1929291 RepID=UPI00272F8BE8|nr:DUF2924 domain-containing protein [Reyranella sp.]MDP2377506.1 DUF2924 domain-containing protein [Reyranella sp.]